MFTGNLAHGLRSRLFLQLLVGVAVHFLVGEEYFELTVSGHAGALVVVVVAAMAT